MGSAHPTRATTCGVTAPPSAGSPCHKRVSTALMATRVLVLSASVGAGHLRAAQAVGLALRQLAPDAIVRNIDLLQLTNATFRKLYGEAYLDIVNKAPH